MQQQGRDHWQTSACWSRRLIIMWTCKHIEEQHLRDRNRNPVDCREQSVDSPLAASVARNRPRERRRKVLEIDASFGGEFSTLGSIPFHCHFFTQL